MCNISYHYAYTRKSFFFFNFDLWGGAASHQSPLPLSWAPLSRQTQDIEKLTPCYHSQSVNTDNNSASH